jgi:hypothetical protein
MAIRVLDLYELKPEFLPAHLASQSVYVRPGELDLYANLRALRRTRRPGTRRRKKWRHHVAVVKRLIAPLQPDDTVIGGGNVTKLEALPSRCRQGENANAFRGAFLLWAKDNVVPPDLSPGRAPSERGPEEPERMPQARATDSTRHAS